MTKPYEDEIAANLDRAEESIQAAKILLAANHFDFAASRAYYRRDSIQFDITRPYAKNL
ncbi:MAG TPA: hypothetical protein VNM22_19620 [Candidatus Limnocylindrales bacterium]|nr:hypothetical protein [Candidatus Limnocylindrales bacterium]